MDRARAIDTALWTLSAVLVATLVVLSVMPQPPIGGPRPMDLLLHVAAYAPTTLTLLLAGVWRPGRGVGPFPNLTITFIGGILVVGILLEVVQGLRVVPGREGEPADAFANAIGVGIGFGVWFLVRTRT